MKNLILAFALLLAFSFSSVYAQEAQQKTLGSKKPATEVKKEELKSGDAQAKTIGSKTETKKADTKKTEKAQAATKKSAKPTKGYVASLNDFIKDGVGRVSKEEAEKQAANGSPIVFVTGSGKSAKVFFVYNEDGSFAGKKLAKYAHNKNVGIIGKTITKNGFNHIIMTMINPLD